MIVLIEILPTFWLTRQENNQYIIGYLILNTNIMSVPYFF